jgi:hypothetical protein
MAAVDPAFARSVARWLRAYPRRWRVVRTDEITDVLADLAPDGARRLDLRSGLGLVRSGWATRWREHPPLGPWLGYVLLERRLDPRYRDWVLDDIEGAFFYCRRLLGASLVFLVISTSRLLAGDPTSPDLLIAWTPAMLLGTALWAPQWRHRVVQRQLVVRAGEVVTASTRLPGLVARHRVDARTWLSGAVVVTGGAVASSVLALVAAPNRVAVLPCDMACVELGTTPVTGTYRAMVASAAVVAALVGLLLGQLARRRLHRWRPVPQPYRWVVPLDATGRARLVSAGLGLGVVAIMVPALTAGLAAPLAALGAGALPVLVTARRVVDSNETCAVAGVDVVRALTGRPDRADRAVDGHLPAAAWLPVGSVVPVPGAVPAR